MKRLGSALAASETPSGAPENRLRLEAGDTLIEVLMTLVVVSLCVVAFLLAFSTSISASAEHRNLATMDTVLRSVSESAISQIQQQASPLFTSCATPASYDGVKLGTPGGYTAAITSVRYWNGVAFGTNCTINSTTPQLITITVSGPLGTSSSISFAVDDPNYSLQSLASGNVARLVFSTQPVGGEKATPFTTQPVITFEDANGNPVTNNSSTITLTISSGTGTSGATLSGCSESENSGVVTFSGCTIDVPGTGYTLSATSGSLTSVSNTFAVSQ